MQFSNDKSRRHRMDKIKRTLVAQRRERKANGERTTMQARIRILKGGVGANRNSLPANQSEKTRRFSILELAPAWAWFAALAVDSIVVCCPTAAATEQSASRAANPNEKTGFKFFTILLLKESRLVLNQSPAAICGRGKYQATHWTVRLKAKSQEMSVHTSQNTRRFMVKSVWPTCPRRTIVTVALACAEGDLSG
jgi:hypothetical protein